MFMEDLDLNTARYYMPFQPVISKYT